jgi:hypothetical protein
MIFSILEILIVIIPLFGSIAFMTLAERKIMGFLKIILVYSLFNRTRNNLNITHTKLTHSHPRI